MSDNQLTRQQIYDRIKETSKEEYILTEMKRLGFWDISEGAPKVSEELITRKGLLRRELNELVDKQRQFQNRELMLKEMRSKRMKEALERRAATKEKRIKARVEKAERWKESKEKDIVYLGETVSGGLSNKELHTETLQKYGLPLLNSVENLAKAMGIGIGALRFLAFNRKTSKTTHYKRFFLAKKTGGKRLISAPMPRLKTAQHWILNEILYKVETHDAAHGFVPKRSIVSNATLHTGNEVVINMDMKDFFPTVTYKRVKGLFKALGYTEQIASIFALITTEPTVDEVNMDGETFYVAQGERFLPQGAPSSPAITNLLCRRLDCRFVGMAQKLGWQYSRYADDMSFSSKTGENVNRVLWQARQIIENEGFVLHPKKIKVMRKGSRQEVTGLTVNKTVNVSREQLKKFRAVLHHIETKGIAGATWGNGFILLTIQGYANYVRMVNPEKGLALVKKVKIILEKAENKTTLQQYMQTPARPKVEKIEKQKETATTIVYGDSALDSNIGTAKKEEKALEWWKLW